MWTKLRVNWLAARSAAATDHFRLFLRDQSGATIIVIGLAMPVLIGAMALAAEVTYWNLHNRAMQNAADAAAIAAATNNGSSYATESLAVASQFGFPNGTANIQVSATNPATAA